METAGLLAGRCGRSIRLDARSDESHRAQRGIDALSLGDSPWRLPVDLHPRLRATAEATHPQRLCSYNNRIDSAIPDRGRSADLRREYLVDDEPPHCDS